MAKTKKQPVAKKKPVVAPVVEKKIGRPNKYAHARDRLRVARFFYAGKSKPDIAKLLSMSETDVDEMLAELDAEWRIESKDLVRAAREALIGELLHIKDEYYEQWEKSKQDRVISSSKVVAAASSPTSVADEDDDEETSQPQTRSKPKRTEVSKRTEQRLGHIGYLEGARAVIKDISDMMGLNAPTKYEHTGEDGKPLIDLSNLTNEQLAALTASLKD